VDEVEVVPALASRVFFSANQVSSFFLSRQIGTLSIVLKRHESNCFFFLESSSIVLNRHGSQLVSFLESSS